MKISLVMIVKNESECLKKCLESAKDLVDEIIVVDTGSQDDTKRIAEEMGAAVFDFKWNNNFADARNYALGKSNGDWNLILDADETIINGKREDLINFAENNPDTIGNILRINKIKNNGEIDNSRVLISRFAPKAALYEGAIHEQLTLSYPRKDMSIVIEHTGYLEKDKSERNLNILLKELKKNPKDDYYLYQTAKSFFTAKRYSEALKYFHKSYEFINKKSEYFKDLEVSYLYTIINLKNKESFDRGLKIIETDKELFMDDPDFNFACGLFYMELLLSNIEKYIDYIDYIEKSYLRCLEIGDNYRCTIEGTGTFKAAYNLGTLYESFGFKDRAVEYYKLSAEYGYNRAKERLKLL